MRGGGAPGDRGTARGFSGPASVRRPASALGGERRGGRGCLGRLLRVADASPRVVLGEPGAHRVRPRHRRRLGRHRRREDPAGGGPAPEAHGREAAASRPRAGRRVLGPALRLGRHQGLEAVPLLPAVDRAGRRAAASRRTDAGKTSASPARAPRAPARAPGGGVRRRGRRVRADRHRLRGRRARDVLRRGPGGARRGVAAFREDRLARTRAVGERVARVRTAAARVLVARRQRVLQVGGGGPRQLNLLRRRRRRRRRFGVVGEGGGRAFLRRARPGARWRSRGDGNFRRRVSAPRAKQTARGALRDERFESF
jgi:hypothetical protein